MTDENEKSALTFWERERGLIIGLVILAFWVAVIVAMAVTGSSCGSEPSGSEAGC